MPVSFPGGAGASAGRDIGGADAGGKGYRGEWSRAGRVTLDGNGDGTIVFDPDNAWQDVVINYVVVQTDQAAGTTPIPTARVYKGSPSPANLEGGTRDGDLDTGVGRITMGAADELNVVFTGGLPGSVASARCVGTYLTRRN